MRVCGCVLVCGAGFNALVWVSVCWACVCACVWVCVRVRLWVRVCTCMGEYCVCVPTNTRVCMCGFVSG